MDKLGLDKYSTVFLIIGVAIIGGGIPTLAKIALQHIPPFTFIFLRFLLAALVLVPAFLFKGEVVKKGKLGNAILVSFLAVLNIIFFALGVRRTTATIAQILYAAVPIIASVFSYIFLKERVNLMKVIGVLLGFMGVSIIVFLPVIGKPSAFDGDFIGNLLVFTGVIFFSIYTVFSKRLQQTCSPLFLTTIFIIMTILVQFFLVPIELKSNPEFWREIPVLSINALLYVGILGTGLYFLIYQYVIKKATPTLASMTFYLQPITSFLWASVLLGEKLTPTFIIGGALALVGAGIVVKNKRI